MGISDIRKSNLRRLVGSDHGAIRDFSEKFNLNAIQLSHILTGFRNMGEKLARKIEKQSGLPSGSLDEESPSETMNLSSEEKDVILAFNALSSDNKELVKRLILSLNSIGN